MSTPLGLPIKFEREPALVFYEEGNGFPLFAFRDIAYTNVPRDWVTRNLEELPFLTGDPIQIVCVGRTRPDAPEGTSCHPASRNLLRCKYGTRDLPMLFEFRWAVEWAQKEGGSVEVWFDQEIVLDFAATNITTRTPFPENLEPLAVLYADEDMDTLHPQLEALRDGRANPSVEAVGRVINP